MTSGEVDSFSILLSQCSDDLPASSQIYFLPFSVQLCITGNYGRLLGGLGQWKAVMDIWNMEGNEKLDKVCVILLFCSSLLSVVSSL